MKLDRRTMVCALCREALVELSPHNWVHASALLSSSLVQTQLSVAS